MRMPPIAVASCLAVAVMLLIAGCQQSSSSSHASAAEQASAPIHSPPTMYAVREARPPEASAPVNHVVEEAAMPEESNVSQPSSAEKITRTEAEWRAMLSPEEYHVLRNKGTERPFENEFDEHFEPGAYACAACGHVLFESETKFNSGCGWPAFYAAKAGDRVQLTPDHAHGMIRVEVTCARCDSHLGHVFDDAPHMPTGQRFCINSISLDFIPAED